MKAHWLILLALSSACGDDDGGTLPDAAPAPIDARPADATPPPDADTRDILERLNSIPGMTATEQTTDLPGYRFFYLEFDQPADHANPGGQRFLQRMTLLHRDETAPMVLHASGYYVSPEDRRAELTRLLSGNQLSVEHRFFEPSRPEPADWAHLTIEQSADDFHRIVVALKPIYGAKWINTGASKGGMTSVYFRRFHPDDVDATVAYVAPMSTAGPDPRYGPFIAMGSDASCRQALFDLQRAVLLQRDELTMMAAVDAMSTGNSYDILGIDKAFEHAVLEMPFYFWQYWDASICSLVPGPGATASENYMFLDAISSVANIADATVIYYLPYFYQAGTQLGFPGFPEAGVADLLLFPGTDVPQSYVPGMPISYDPAAMADVGDWLATDGERIIFLYGENDPWSAAMFELGNAFDSYIFVVPAGNHGSNLLDLPEPDRTAAVERIEAWIGVDIALPMLSNELPYVQPRAPL